MVTLLVSKSQSNKSFPDVLRPKKVPRKTNKVPDNTMVPTIVKEHYFVPELWRS